MTIISWATAAPAITAAFLASLVEVVEAFTIVLAVGTVRGWRPSLIGAGAGLAFLAALVVVLGPLLELVPIRALQLVVGVLLLLFGLRWLRKSILRAAGILALHDETKAFADERTSLIELQRRGDPILIGSRDNVIQGGGAGGHRGGVIVIAVGAGPGVGRAGGDRGRGGLSDRRPGRPRLFTDRSPACRKTR